MNAVARNNASCFFIACQEDSLSVVKVLLADPRVDLDIAMVNGETALWIAAHRGRAQVVKWILASERKFTLGAIWKGNGLSEGLQASNNGFLDIAELLARYQKDAETTCFRLRKELEILGEHIHTFLFTFHLWF